MALTPTDRTALIDYRLCKATATLREARDVMALGHWSLTANRLYYAIYYACSALLLAYGYAASTHSGVISLMGKHFVKSGILEREEGKLLSELFQMRQMGDYGDIFDWEQADIEPLMEPVGRLVEKIRGIINAATA